MSSHLFVFARLLHVLSGTLWVGGALLIAGSIVPAIRASGSSGAAVMRQLTTVQRLPYILLGIGAVTILSGGYLIQVLSNGSFENWLNSGPGATYALGACAGLAAAVIGMAINIPTANRLGRLAADPSATPELARVLARRLAIGTRTVAVLLILATSAMAVARYVG